MYIDTDVYALRDIRVLRESGFGAVTGGQWLWRDMNSGTWMTEPHGKWITGWRDGSELDPTKHHRCPPSTSNLN